MDSQGGQDDPTLGEIMSSYQPGIPTGFVNLDTDYANIQGNFQQLDTTFGIDHTTFSNQTAQNGYHTNIHLIPNSTTATNPPNNQPVVAPAATVGFGQLFSAQINDGINTDEALYFLTGGNRVLQLTRNFLPSSANNGYTFLPGGLMLQWGRVTGLSGAWPTSDQTLLFTTNNINFANNCFAVFTTFIGPTSSSSGDITINSQSKLNFHWQFSGSSSSSFGGFFWVAIGN